MRETMARLSNVKYQRCLYDEETMFPYRRGLREGELRDMMDLALFARIEYEQLVEMQRNMGHPLWRSIEWIYTSNPRLLLWLANSRPDFIERNKVIDQAAWSQTCKYSRNQSSFRMS